MSAKLLTAAGAAVLTVGSAGAYAQQVTLTPANVVGGSTEYSTPQFARANVLDKQTGAITEENQNQGDADGGYFLAPDNSPDPDFIVIDLGAPTQIDYFQLFNTRNAQYQDRGTGNFTITASNTLSELLTNDLGTQIASGTLAAETGLPGQTPSNELTAQTADVTSPTAFQFIRFNALSVAAVNPYGGAGSTSVGLNEIRVFEVPEPSVAGLAVAGLLGLAARRRRRA